MHRGFMGSIFIIEEKCGENPAGTKRRQQEPKVDKSFNAHSHASLKISLKFYFCM